MGNLRKAMRRLFKQRLKVMIGGPPVSAIRYREDMMNTCLSSPAPADEWRRSVIVRLFNGDWRVRGEVQHYDQGQVAGGRSGILRAFYVHGIRALLPRVLSVLQRKNWTGTGACIDDIGLPSAVHGLLGDAFLEAFQGKAAPATVAPCAPGPGLDASADCGAEWELGGPEAKGRRWGTRPR